MNRQTTLFLGLAVVLVMAVFVLKAKMDEKSFPQLRKPPSISPISTEGLAKVPDAELLDRIYLECLRRMYVANKGFLAGPQVLSESACHLWVIAMLEDRLCSDGFRSVLSRDRQPGSTPLFPSLAQLRDAYRGIGQETPASIIQDALSRPDYGVGDQDPYARLNALYLKWVGTGTRPLRLAYAKQRLKTLFPAETSSP